MNTTTDLKAANQEEKSKRLTVLSANLQMIVPLTLTRDSDVEEEEDEDENEEDEDDDEE